MAAKAVKASGLSLDSAAEILPGSGEHVLHAAKL